MESKVTGTSDAGCSNSMTCSPTQDIPLISLRPFEPFGPPCYPKSDHAEQESHGLDARLRMPGLGLRERKHKAVLGVPL